MDTLVWHVKQVKLEYFILQNSYNDNNDNLNSNNDKNGNTNNNNNNNNNNNTSNNNGITINNNNVNDNITSIFAMYILSFVLAWYLLCTVTFICSLVFVIVQDMQSYVFRH